MKRDTTPVEINKAAADDYEQLRAERHRTLVAPEDDMWATFADLAEPHSLTYDGRLAGRFSIDEEGRLHGFYVTDDFESEAAALLAHVVTELNVPTAMASTVDPVFLSLALDGGSAEPVALIYHHVATSEVTESVDVRVAAGSDHAAAVAFSRAPDSFLLPYLAQRIELGELYLVEADGEIVASGECRVDTRTAGNAHLGFVVAAAQRGQGLGARLMHTLTDLSLAQDLTPLCSTEPTNLAAQKAIRRGGFRVRHRVFGVELGQR